MQSDSAAAHRAIVSTSTMTQRKQQQVVVVVVVDVVRHTSATSHCVRAAWSQRSARTVDRCAATRQPAPLSSRALIDDDSLAAALASTMAAA